MTTQQPEALRLANVCSNLTRYSMDAHLIAAELGRQHARITDLEAQLEAIGAGGVSGPLIGQPQAMPDLSQLTERGAKAWAGVDAQGLREGFTAADMATASAQGFRDGVASLSLTAAGQEPVAWLYEHKLLGTKQAFTTEPPPGLKEKCTPLYSHPSPPEGMAGWRPTSEMRAVVAVAVTMLYDTHPEDVLRVFDLCELEKISIITMLLGSQQVEDIYRSAWDHLTAAPLASEAKEPK